MNRYYTVRSLCFRSGVEMVSRVDMEHLGKVRAARGIMETPTRHLLVERMETARRRKLMRKVG